MSEPKKMQLKTKKFTLEDKDTLNDKRQTTNKQIGF